MNARTLRARQSHWYMGELIEPAPRNAYGFRWCALVRGLYLRTDGTLADMRQMIRARLETARG